MKGFFDKEIEIEKKKKSIKKTKSSEIQYTCEKCGLYKKCISPKMPVTGEGKKKILIIAEAPGEKEDEKNIQLIGQSGQLFRDYLKDLNYDLDRDFWKTNSVICHPPKNKTPTQLQLKCCRKNLLETIEKYKPKGIILLGKVATEAVIGYRLSGRLNSVSFSDLLGECIPDQEMKTWLCPIYHPAYILRSDYRQDLKNLYKNQIKKAIEKIEADNFYEHNYEKDIFVTEDENEAIKWINGFRKKEIFAFDYETTGIKPHRKGHKIVSASISDGVFGYAFPFFSSDIFQTAWRKLMKSPAKKIAHEARFEQQWTKVICGYYVKNLVQDTAIANRCIRNLKKTQLKLSVYNRFGIIGYDAEMDKYIRGHKPGEDSKSDNRFNQIEDAPIQDLLKYNALDSLFTYKLYEDQQIHITGFQKLGYDFFIEGNEYLLRATENGIYIDEQKMNESNIKAGKRINRLLKKLNESEEIKKWPDKDFNFNSSTQLSKLLFDILKIECPEHTVKGNPKTDKFALQKIDIPFVKDILEYRRWEKAKDTYIAQYKREITDGKIHPFFNLSRVSTFRSSSNSPNFQNQPKRDKVIKEMIRRFVIPRSGNRLVEWDYKQIEVCMAGCYTRDPNLINYIVDPTTDMHRDSAADLFLMDDISKEDRYVAKNGFVFPSFYGSYYEQTAPELWNRMSKEAKQNLRKHGIKTFSQFLNHVREVEDKFWNKRFVVFNEWKKKTLIDYEKKGYIDLYTGFRCYAPMKRNEVINYRFQGSAFHCLLWTFIKVMKEMEIKQIQDSFLIGQIHDAIVGDINPEDEKYMDELIIEYGTKKIREEWDWIIVPLTIEKEQSEINGNWAEMSECEMGE